MVAKQAEIQILQISKNDIAIAKGVHIPEAVMSFDDSNKSVISYPDTGIFVLFKGSRVSSTADKYKPYIGTDCKTTREIVFQSKNAAAQFVLGDQGRTNDWKLLS